jgi:hypothetical protein
MPITKDSQKTVEQKIKKESVIIRVIRGQKKLIRVSQSLDPASMDN